jgi:hypothetical protein
LRTAKLRGIGEKEKKEFEPGVKGEKELKRLIHNNFLPATESLKKKNHSF